MVFTKLHVKFMIFSRKIKMKRNDIDTEDINDDRGVDEFDSSHSLTSSNPPPLPHAPTPPPKTVPPQRPLFGSFAAGTDPGGDERECLNGN